MTPGDCGSAEHTPDDIARIRAPCVSQGVVLRARSSSRNAYAFACHYRAAINRAAHHRRLRSRRRRRSYRTHIRRACCRPAMSVINMRSDRVISRACIVFGPSRIRTGAVYTAARSSPRIGQRVAIRIVCVRVHPNWLARTRGHALLVNRTLRGRITVHHNRM